MLPHQLAAAIPERDFLLLQHYAAKRMLPMRRLELHLAQLSLLVATAHGAKDKTLSDFLFDPVDDTPVDDLDAAVDFFGFSPIVKD